MLLASSARRAPAGKSAGRSLTVQVTVPAGPGVQLDYNVRRLDVDAAGPAAVDVAAQERPPVKCSGPSPMAMAIETMRCLARRHARVAHRLLRGNGRSVATAAPPIDLPLPDLAAAIAPAIPALKRDGFAVVDGAFGETWCHLLRDDIITLAERRLLGRNATHLVRRGETAVLAKRAIYEAEPCVDAAARAACPRLTRLYEDDGLARGLERGLGERLGRRTIKVQVNGGGGACFPLHFDSDPALDGRVATALLYLNPDWAPRDGGELRLLPFPRDPVDVEPVFDRLVVFSSRDMLHRVLPSAALRLCLTLWFYASDGGGDRRAATAAAPPAGSLADPETRRLAARFRYRDAWAASIEESHDPSPSRDAALANHWADVARIEKVLAARGVDPADAAADGFVWFGGYD